MAPAFSIEAIPALSDNYVFLLSRGDQAVLVDPPEAEPCIDLLEQRGLALVAVLHTHHHHDHTGGTAGLLQRWPHCRVYGAAADLGRIPWITDPVVEADRVVLLEQPIEVLEVPGHTRAHLAYYLPSSGDVFCGDTLFAGGCGRLFEGTPQQMWQALQRLAGLPPQTRLWCAHEYTAANLRWARVQVGGDGPLAQALQQRLEQVEAQRARGEATVPTTVALERATNLFVRSPSAAALAELREHKDHWRG